MYPKEYLEYLVHFHGSRDYFECHEILEEYWKRSPATDRKRVWVGLIQIAVALYHQRRNNFHGAEKMMRSAIQILTNETKELHSLGIEWRMMLEHLNERLEEMESRKPYTSMNLPIGDPILRKECSQLCHQKGWVWEKPSVLDDEHLIHKHTLRDRTNVIEERERQIQDRQTTKPKTK
jgi:predicted metal-dependent hydrolase